MTARAETKPLLDAKPLRAGRLHDLPVTYVLLLYCVVSTGMMVCNKLALSLLPPLSLVGIQALAAVLIMSLAKPELGSWDDRARFMVVPLFFCGMLSFSALVLHQHSLTFLIVFRSWTPVVSMMMERCVFTACRPLTVEMALALSGAVVGAVLYVWSDASYEHFTAQSLLFCSLNMLMASGDRIANRWVVAERPVRLNNEGMVLINNFLTCLFCSALAVALGEGPQLLSAGRHLGTWGASVVLFSCVAGAALGVVAFAVQRRITATDMQVLINANKVAVILIEVAFMHKVLTGLPLLGCVIALASGAAYSHAVTKTKVGDKPKELPK